MKVRNGEDDLDLDSIPIAIGEGAPITKGERACGASLLPAFVSYFDIRISGFF
jgi:hypothetical protein